MKTMTSLAILILLTCGGIPFGCSDHPESDTHQPAVETMTGSAAEEAVNGIRKPIDKARKVQELQNARVDDMNKAAKDQ